MNTRITERRHTVKPNEMWNMWNADVTPIAIAIKDHYVQRVKKKRINERRSYGLREFGLNHSKFLDRFAWNKFPIADCY